MHTREHGIYDQTPHLCIWTANLRKINIVIFTVKHNISLEHNIYSKTPHLDTYIYDQLSFSHNSITFSVKHNIPVWESTTKHDIYAQKRES